MKIAVTGGPSAGKTAIVELISKQFRDSVVAVPEAASILFRGGFPRRGTPVSLQHQQRAIYFVQVELEALARAENPAKVILCDRGTVDGAAYWPGPPHEFFESVGTTGRAEISRYDYVIHLESPNGHAYDRSNPVRIEQPYEAHLLDTKTKEIWSSHPRRFIIHCHKNFSEKVSEVFDHVSMIIETSCDSLALEVRDNLSKPRFKID